MKKDQVITKFIQSTRIANCEKRWFGSIKGNEEDGGRETGSIEEMAVITREE